MTVVDDSGGFGPLLAADVEARELVEQGQSPGLAGLVDVTPHLARSQAGPAPDESGQRLLPRHAKRQQAPPGGGSLL